MPEPLPLNLLDDFFFCRRRAGLKVVEGWNSPGTGYPEAMSTLTKTLIEEITNAPEIVQREVFEFLTFLKARHTGHPEGAENLLPLAQTAWAADWNTPEEDEAWRDL